MPLDFSNIDLNIFEEEEEQVSAGEQQFDQFALDAEKETGVPFNLIKAVAATESNFDPAAKAKTSSAQGYMQLIESTAKAMGVDPTDPKQNVLGGARYLKQMLDTFGGNEEQAIAAYFKGPGFIRQRGIDELDVTGGTTARDYVNRVNNSRSRFETKDDQLFQNIDFSGLKLGQPEQPVQEQQSVLRAIGGQIVEGTKGFVKSLARGLTNKDWRETGVQLWDQVEAQQEQKIISMAGKASQEEIMTERKKLGTIRKMREEATRTGKALAVVDEAVQKALPEESVRNLDGALGVIQDIAGVVPDLLGSIATGLIAGPTAPVAIGARVMGGVQESLEKAGVEDSAERGALAFGVALPNAILESTGASLSNATVNKIINKVVKQKLGNKILTAGLTEGITEALQEYPDAFAEFLGTRQLQKKYKDKPLEEQIEMALSDFVDTSKQAAYSGFLGAVTGGLAGVPGAPSDSKIETPTEEAVVEQVTEEQIPEIEQFIEQAPPEAIVKRLRTLESDLQEQLIKTLPEDKQNAVEQLRATEAVEAPVSEDQVETAQTTPEAEDVVKEPQKPPVTLDMTKFRKDHPTKEEGQAIAEKLGVRFDGLQETGDETMGTLMTFTDTERGGTFMAYTEDQAKQLLEEERTRLAEEVEVAEEDRVLQEVPAQEERAEAEVGIRDDKEIREEPQEEIVIPTVADIKKTIKWGEKRSKAEQSSLGKKANRAIREAVRSGNMEIIEAIQGKTYEEVADIAEKAGVAFGPEGRTDVKVERDKILEDVSTGLDYTAKAESQLRKIAGKDFDKIFSVMEGEKGKVVLVEDTEAFNALRGERTTELNEEVLQRQYTEDFDIGDFDALRTAKLDEGTKITPEARTKGFQNIVSKLETDKPIFIVPVDNITSNGKLIKMSGPGRQVTAAVSDMGDHYVIPVSKDIYDKGGVFTSTFHEAVGHIGVENFLTQNKRYGSRMWAMFKKDRGSDLMAEIGRNYKEDLDKLPDKKSQQDLLFREWLAFNVQNIREEYMDNDGNWTRKPPNVLQRVWSNLKDFVKDTLGKTTSEERIRRDTVKMVDAMLAGRKKGLTSKVVAKREGVKKQVKKDLDKALGVETTKTQFQKEKPKLPKPPDTPRQRTEKFIADRAALEKSTDKNYKIRWFNYINNQLSGSKNESYRNQIFDAIDKVKTPNVSDPNYKKALDLIDEVRNVNKNRSKVADYKRFKKRHRKILGKVNDKTVTELGSSIEKVQNEFDEFNNLKRLKERELVSKPFKKGTTDPTTPRGYYAKGIEQGTVEIIQQDGKDYYKITPKGTKRLQKLNESDIQQQFDDVESSILEFKEKANEHLESTKKAKKARQEAIKTGAIEITQRVKELPKRGKRIIDRAAKGLRKANMKHESLRYKLDKLDGFTEGAFTKNIWNELDKGRDKESDMQFALDDFLQKRAKEQNLSEKDILQAIFDKPSYEITVKDSDGKTQTIKLNSSEKINLHMLSKNEKALDHLLEGGFAHGDQETIYNLTHADLNDIKLNSTEQKIADIMFEYYDKQAEFINETSMEDVGYKIATEEFYSPIRVVDWALENKSEAESIETPKDMDQLRQSVFGYVNPSSLKGRVGSRKPIVLEGAFEAMNRVTPLVAKYYGNVIPYKRTMGILDASKQDLVQQGLGDELRDIKKNINQVVVPPASYNPFFSAVDSLNTIGALGFKMSTASIQPLSFMLVANNVGKYTDAKLGDVLKHMPKVMSENMSGVTKKMREYSFFRRRLDGMVNADLGDMLMRTQKKRTEKKLLGNKLSKTDFKLSRLPTTFAHMAMKPIQAMDMVAIKGIWTLAEAEVRATGMKKSDAGYYDKVAELAKKYTIDTQPTFDALDRPEVLRKTGTGMDFPKRQWYKFQTQILKNAQLLKQGGHEIAKGNVAKGLQRIGNVVLSQYIGIAILKAFWKTMRGQMEPWEWEDGEQWITTISSNLATILPFIGPGVSQLISGYAPSFGGMYDDWFNQMQLATKDMGDGEITKGLGRLAPKFLPTRGLKEPLEVLQNFNVIDEIPEILE